LKKIRGIAKGIPYYPVNLYRDDFEQIINILSEISDQVEISDDDYEYESLDELINQKGLKPKKVFISSYSPHVVIDLEPHSIFLYRSNSDKGALYAYDRIKEVLRKRRSILSRVINPAVGIFFFSIFIFLIIFIPIDFVKSWFPNRWSRLSLIILLFGIPILSFFFKHGAFSSFFLIRFHERNNFFTRQKDDLIKIVIGAIIGVLLTLLVSILKGN